ncbi:MAG: NAD(P)H-hydrate epimerase [Chloroflexi bacterium HGW-Chloroflexi-3]|nr:MAG: NAD(P)H-hydrate epimerase [Chloroflexi bacterium HGW-Chloroflexi-3]
MEIPFPHKEVPFLTTQQMIEVDRAMMEDYKIELIQMMENAGRNLAHLARIRFLDNNPVGKQIVVLAGSGGNGGGALVAARRLHNWGANVIIIISKPPQNFTPIPGHQLDIAQRMNIPIYPFHQVNHVQKPALILDGLIGYSLKGSPHGSIAELINWANQQTTSVLALDVPSGIDATSGTLFDPAIKATATLTLALPKQGLQIPDVRVMVGELYIADISVPPELYAREKLDLIVKPIFAQNEILRLW